MSEEADITIIGAGVVGLAIATEIADEKKKIYVLEKNQTFGQETSSRNSQVIHAGIYYPPESLKAKTCVEGNSLLYDICRKNGIAFKNLTKLIVATNEEEINKLKGFKERGEKNGVAGLRLLSRKELKKLEPNVEGLAALFVPSTGIIGVHSLMKYFLKKAKDSGVEFVYKTKVTGITRLSKGYQVKVVGSGESFNFFTRVLINSAGLFADQVAQMAGIDIEKAGYKLNYCKGEYFSVGNGKNKLVSRLVYPVPPPEGTGVGIHITLDLDGRMRLGPGIKYIGEIDYVVNESSRQLFYEGVKKFLPAVEIGDLEPEMAGIRPKLQRPGEGMKDFVICHEKDKGFEGLINLIGIESPGLTASPAIARLVGELIEKIL